MIALARRTTLLGGALPPWAIFPSEFCHVPSSQRIRRLLGLGCGGASRKPELAGGGGPGAKSRCAETRDIYSHSLQFAQTKMAGPQKSPPPRELTNRGFSLICNKKYILRNGRNRLTGDCARAAAEGARLTEPSQVQRFGRGQKFNPASADGSSRFTPWQARKRNPEKK